MKRIFFVLVMLCPFLKGQAQLRPLSIGDTLPPLVLRSIINSGDTSIDLGKLKFKLLLIDFWSAGCASCYHSLGKLDSLEKQFPEIKVISVTQNDSDSLLLSRLRRSPATRKVHIPVLTYDTILHLFFPHQLVSHIVWLDSNRIVKAITGSDYVSKEKIELALQNKTRHWSLKVDQLDFDPKQSILTYVKELPPPLSPLLYSGMTRYIDGISPPTGISYDSTNGVKRFSVYNFDIKELCKTALELRPNSRFFSLTLRVKNKERFICPDNIPYTDWLRQYGYCFFLSVSINTPDEILRSQFANDLRVWLERVGVSIRLVKTKPIPLYEIVETSLSN